jgi:hypothetical protein
MDETAARTEAMAKDKAESLAAADRYMKVCSEYLESQDKALKEQVKLLDGGQAAAGAQSTAVASASQAGLSTSEAVLDRARKIAIAN